MNPAPPEAKAYGPRLAAALDRLRASAPLVHNITNYVVMNLTANALLAAGASPAMVHAQEEVEEFAGLASSLAVNLGTLSPVWVESMRRAVAVCARRGTPWVLDPVGAGATRYRTATAVEFLGRRPTIVRGNASEIIALGQASATGPRGVDSVHGTDEALGTGRALAREFGTVVSISGAVDAITDGSRVWRVSNGHPLMPRVTGLGCTATALTAAFAAVEPDPLFAAVHALVLLGVAGERAAAPAGTGPGTLAVRLLDELAALDGPTLRLLARVEGQAVAA